MVKVLHCSFVPEQVFWPLIVCPVCAAQWQPFWQPVDTMGTINLTQSLAERFVHIRFAYSSYKCLTCEVIMNGMRPEQERFEPFGGIPFMNKEVSIPKQYHM